MASAVLTSPDASRLGPPGVLTPASENPMNKASHDGSSAGPRKRKRGTTTLVSTGSHGSLPSSHPMEELLKPPISIRPHPPNVLAKSSILLPLMLIGREHVPLSYLDLSSPSGTLPPARFFESRIRILELEGRLGSSILIARCDSSRNSYAIERNDNGFYTVCKIGDWVELDKLSQQSSVFCQQRVRPFDGTSTNAKDSTPPLTTPHLYKENKRKRLAIEEIQSMVRRRPRSETQAVNDSQKLALTGDSPSQLPTPESQTELLPAPLPQADLENATQSEPPLERETTGNDQKSAQDIFQNIRNQYFEVLYHSMGSLAYFAKGPLSRARADFHLNTESNLEMRDLIEFLKGLVMTTVLIDRKYAETIPEILSQMKTAVDSSGNEASSKKKRPKKMKLGKNGIWTGEDAHVKKWWTATKPEMRDDEVSIAPPETRFHIACLRTRETQLQMILILEILALEAICPAEDAVESQLPGMEPTTPAGRAEPTAKKRNKHNLPFLVEVHADRLCISQSVALDEVKAIAESQMKGLDGQKGSKPSSDPLKDFCVDIILPFFSARLPDLCDMLNRKLGGPVIVSPPKAKVHKSSSVAEKARPKPGSAAKRPAPGKSTRNLDRVLSNERLRRSVSRGPTDAIAHMRSATAAPIPGLKREMSEPRMLGGIPHLEPAQLKEKPPNLFARSMSLTGADDLKARKRAMVDAELQNAISALKKPNRQLAGKAIVEETERRLFAGGTGSRKKQKPPVRTSSDRVVKATPVNNRFRDALAGESFSGKSERPQVPGFFDSVPSSSTAPARRKSLFDSPNAGDTPTSRKVQATPVRPSSALDRPSRSAQEDVVPPSSPSIVRHSPVAYRQTSATLQVSRNPPADDVVPASSPLQARKSAMPRSFASQPSAGRAPTEAPMVIGVSPQKQAAKMNPATPAGKSQTIYQRLGWDDEDLDDLA